MIKAILFVSFMTDILDVCDGSETSIGIALPVDTLSLLPSLLTNEKIFPGWKEKLCCSSMGQVEDLQPCDPIKPPPLHQPQKTQKRAQTQRPALAQTANQQQPYCPLPTAGIYGFPAGTFDPVSDDPDIDGP